MYAKQQSVIDLNKQMEEMRLLYEKQKYERRQQLASLEYSWTKSFSQGSSKIHPVSPNSSPSDTLNTYPRPPQPPDPPDCKSHTEFPKFDGTLLREWFRRCDEYFYLHQTPPEMRVRIASPHMIGKALQWHTNYIRNNFGMFPPWLDYTNAISAEFGDNDALLMHQSSLSPYQNQNNQSHYNSPNTTSLLPSLETTKTLPYKPSFPTETNMEKSPMKLLCEEIQGSGMRGLCMSADGSYANGHHLESKKCQIFVVESDDEESFDVREPSEVTVEEIIDKSVDMIREEKSTPENESSPEVSPQILLSQFQVSLSSLEPGHRYHKESLVVVNDLSYDHGCVIGKTIGSIYSEIGQDNSLDKEEFVGLTESSELRLSREFLLMNFGIFMNPQLLHDKRITQALLVGLVGTEEKLSDRFSLANYVWKPGGVSIELDKWKWSDKCYELSRVMKLMQGLYSTWWSYGKVAELTQELQQPKTYLKEIKLKELDRLVAYTSVGPETWLVKCSCEYKIQNLLLCYNSLKVQEKQLFLEDNVEFLEVSIISMRKGLVCDKEKKKLRNARVDGCVYVLDRVNSLGYEESVGLIEFGKLQLAMEFFLNPRLFHDKRISVFLVLRVALALLVVFEHNKAIRTRYKKAEIVDTRKINFIGEFAVSIILAVIGEHEDIERTCVLLKMSLNGGTHTLSHLAKDYDVGRRITWFKLTLNSVSQQTTGSAPQSYEVQRETNWNDVTQTEATWGAKLTSLGYVENSLAEFCAYEVYHPPKSRRKSLKNLLLLDQSQLSVEKTKSRRKSFHP